MFVGITRIVTMNSIKRLSPVCFTFEKWKAGSLSDLGLQTREWSIVSPMGKALIRRSAIGYCDGSSVFVRCKTGTVAIMFENEKFEQWWTHLTQREFELVFCEQS